MLLFFFFLELRGKRDSNVNYIVILQHACIGLREAQIETEETFEAQYENILFSSNTGLTLSGSGLNCGYHGHI